MNSEDAAISSYDAHASEVAECYQWLGFEEVHGWLIPYLPKPTDATVLDAGAGSRRGAAWFAWRGHEVVAVEPSAGLRAERERRHCHSRIRWINDRLPDPKTVAGLAGPFEFMLLSAVWMHVKPSDLRKRRSGPERVNLFPTHRHVFLCNNLGQIGADRC